MASFSNIFEHDNHLWAGETTAPVGRRTLAYDAKSGRLWYVFTAQVAGPTYDTRVAYSDDSGATWTTELVDNTNTGYGSSLVLDSSGVPHLVLRTSTCVYHTYRTAVDTWAAVEAIITVTDYIADVSSAIDSSDVIHLVYIRNAHTVGQYNRVNYVTGVRGSWNAKETVYEKEITVASQYHEKYDTGLVLDSNEIPHVIYASIEDFAVSSKAGIMYTNRIGGSWITPETIQARDGAVGFARPILDLDSSDDPRVIYRNAEAFGSGDKWRVFYTSRQTEEADWAANKETVKSDNSATIPFDDVHTMVVDTSDKVKVVISLDDDACYSYRESAEADWANNWVNLTSGGYNKVEQPNLLGSLLPTGNRYASGVSFTFLQEITSGSDEHIVFCDHEAVYPTVQKGYSFGYILD